MPQVPYVAATYTTSVTAAQLNHLEQGANDLSYAPAVHVYHNATQSITNATDTALAFNTERFDQAGNAADTQHDTVTNNSRLTCRYAGIYQITTNVAWVANGTGARFIWVRLNAGSTTFARVTQLGSAATNSEMVSSAIWSLAVNDFVECYVHQTSGGALNVQASTATTAFNCEFMMVRVG